MKFVTTASEIQAACKAGLTLCGSDHGTPEWIGTTEQFIEFMSLTKN